MSRTETGNPDFDDWETRKARQWSATFFVGHKRQRSPLTPNLCSQIRESCAECH